MYKEPKKYELPEDTKQMVSEPAAVAYTVPQQHSAMYNQISNLHDPKEIEAFAKKACWTDDAYEFHKQRGFYKSEMPEQEELLSEEQLVASLDEADAEGYTTDEETKHIMNLWKVVD